MKNKLDVMQGRLLPKYRSRYQAHPVGYWQHEFKLAQGIQLDCIEFILDYNDYELNPLTNSKGVQEIKAISAKTGVEVHSICADYFMEAPLHTEAQNVADRSYKVMVDLLNTAADLGVSDIVIPCVDGASLQQNTNSRIRFIQQMSKITPIAETLNVNLSLETDLSLRLLLNY